MVAGNLYHRAKTVCSSPQLLQGEEHHLFQTLKRCKYPTLAMNSVKMRSQNPIKTQEEIKNSIWSDQQQQTEFIHGGSISSGG